LESSNKIRSKFQLLLKPDQNNGNFSQAFLRSSLAWHTRRLLERELLVRHLKRRSKLTRIIEMFVHIRN
jgi:hypothetical protein